MFERIIRFIFFGNYFVGFLGIVLSLETSIQLRIPFNSGMYYLLLFSGIVMYYTYAYSGALQSHNSSNPRSAWYSQHQSLVKYYQWFFFSACIVLGALIVMKDISGLVHLPIIYWLIVGVLGLSSVLYYGLLPKSFFKINLRNTGWLKAFVIGFVWAGCVSLIPIVMLRIDGASYSADPVLVIGLFIKNWMFCTVNAIMFDMKDYEDDSNKQLKTFVVRFGVEKTIFFVLIPLSLIGVFAMGFFAHYRHLGLAPFMINLIPFLLLLFVSYSMLQKKSIFYYLIVIDGLVLIKGICGIIAMQFVQT